MSTYIHVWTVHTEFQFIVCSPDQKRPLSAYTSIMIYVRIPDRTKLVAMRSMMQNSNVSNRSRVISLP